MKYLVLTGVLLLILGILVVPTTEAKIDYDCAGQPLYLNNTVINDWIDVRVCNGGLLENLTVYQLELDASNNMVIRNVLIKGIGAGSIGACAKIMWTDNNANNNTYINVSFENQDINLGTRMSGSSTYINSNLGWMDTWATQEINYFINTSFVANLTCNSIVNSMSVYNQYYVDYIIDDGSNPLENVNISVYNSTGGLESQGFTDSNGQLQLVSTDWYCQECLDNSPQIENISLDGDPHTVYFTLSGYDDDNTTYTLGGELYDADGESKTVTFSMSAEPPPPPEPISGQIINTALDTSKLIFGISILIAVVVLAFKREKIISTQSLLALFGLIIIGIVLLGILLAI
ncbi:hypothetical protein KKC87_04455 [Patescibacteria group bacterium]|nr:hypothetical protein [Patescibacteria group bacterium]